MDNIYKFVSNSFIKETKYPFISVLLFIIVLILNIIQYTKNDKTYLQSLIKHKYNNPNFENLLLFFYDIVGINGFIQNTPAHVLILLLTYGCLSLIEMNIGHISVLFFLLVISMYQYSIEYFQSVNCTDELYNNERGILLNSPYCCGSFINLASIGFVLYVIQNNIKKLQLRIICWIIMGLVWGGLIIYENYITYVDLPNNSVKTCALFFWHATNFLLGILCGAALSNTNRYIMLHYIK